MEKRKHIAVIVLDVHDHYQATMLKGLMEQAFSMNVDVSVFSMFRNYDDKTTYQHGEENIFELINYELFDGFIYASGLIQNDDLKEKLDKKLLECGKPVVCMDTVDDRFTSVLADDALAFENLVDHFIDVHGFTKIFCLTGFEGLVQAEERLNGYKKSLEKHGIEVNPDYYRYGDFWEAAAKQLAHEIIEGKIEKPHAVVCANDWMAINLCNTLTDNGIHVPDDIAIAGYDFMEESFNNVPSITSYSSPNHSLGARSMAKLMELITGEHCECVSNDIGFVITAQSCGCGKNAKEVMEKRKEELKQQLQVVTLFDNCHMAEAMTDTSDLANCIVQLDNFTYLIPEMENYYLCLCYNWDEVTDEGMRNNSYLRDGYADTMNIVLWKAGEVGRQADVQFDKTIMLPALWEEREEPAAFFFNPIHFNDRCFGYEVLSYGNKLMTYDKVYRSWSKNINNALEFIRVQNYLNTVNKRLFMTSVRDALTGIFNRKGFDEFSIDIMNDARKNRKKMFILAADLDRLKMINDTYGHAEGDNAILITARALNTSCINNEICARTGGDEFVVIGCGNYDEEIIKSYTESINSFLARYNESSDKPYKVEASLGFYCDYVDDETDLKEIWEVADKEMYDNKVRRKANRVD
ncbi:MAG: GGDEF domain-containing protein [Oscillospiraceae bacterium]|nr:GGDEF domain-containing protein [Oscillospiraceae bacterium]